MLRLVLSALILFALPTLTQVGMGFRPHRLAVLSSTGKTPSWPGLSVVVLQGLQRLAADLVRAMRVHPP